MANSILDALLGANQEAAAENPYAPYSAITDQVSTALADPKVSQQYGLKDTMIASLLSGLVGGGLQQLGTNYTNEQSNLYQNALINSMNGNNTMPEGINENLFKKAQQQTNLFAVQQKLQDQAAEAELTRQLKLEAGKSLAKSPKGASLLLNNLFKKPGSVDSTEAETQPIAKPNTSMVEPTKKLKTLAELRQEAADEADRLEITPGDRADYIGKVMTPTTKETERFQKELEDKATKQRDMELTLQGAEQAINEAGSTGSWKGTIGGMIDRNILEPLGNEGAKKRNAADAVLSQLQQAGIKANKTPGLGSISDFESKKIFEASPGTGNTPEQNRAILSKIALKNELDKDYLGFMNNWMDTFGSKKGAEQGWNSYKDAAKVVVQDVDGTYTINPNRPDWRELDLQSLADAPTPKTSTSTTKSITVPTTQKRGADGNMYNVRDLGNGKFEIVD